VPPLFHVQVTVVPVPTVVHRGLKLLLATVTLADVDVQVSGPGPGPGPGPVPPSPPPQPAATNAHSVKQARVTLMLPPGRRVSMKQVDF
jgi:hypothetical protein